ncbi:hypothetical protein ISS21_01020 [Patescibacteria group bacterium]|nr:hypothetical protein [Patescibacteria group bacterium]
MKFRKKSMLFAFFILGVSALIAQTLIIRELMITFYGNELFSSLSLGFWLVLVGLGSLFLSKLFQKLNSLKTILSSHILIALFLPLEIFLIRLIKNLFTLPGETPNLLSALGATFLALIPLCLILGVFWTIASKLYTSLTNQFSLGLTKAYFFETLGFIIAGLGFSFFLVSLNEFLVVFLIIVLNLVSALLLAFSFKQKLFFKSLIVFLLAVSLIFLFSPLVKQIQNKTLGLRFKNQILEESVNSKYGNLAVTKLTKESLQYNFFQNGLLIGSSQEKSFNEQLVHPALLQSPDPKKVLLIGQGFNGTLNEILKHPIEEVYYLELDPKLISLTEKYLPVSLAQTLKNPRVKIIYQDARAFLQKNQEKFDPAPFGDNARPAFFKFLQIKNKLLKIIGISDKEEKNNGSHLENASPKGAGFDVIILNLPDPSSLLLNRFYTQEFFKKLKNILNPQGLISTYVSFAPNYFSQEAVNLNASVYQALKQNFSQILVLPGEISFFFASEQNTLSVQPEKIIDRFKTREIETNFITPQWLDYYLTNDRVAQVNILLAESKQMKANSDLLPSAYLANLLFWLKQFQPRMIKFLNALGKIHPGYILLALSIIYLACRRAWRKKISSTKFLPLITAIPDFTLLGLGILFIFCFQIFYGYIYHYIALLTTLSMAGIALGNWWALKIMKKAEVKINTLIKIYLSLVLLCCFMFLALKFSLNWWLIAPLLAGFLIGLDFPLTNSVFLKKQRKPEQKTGVIYSADLIGSCLGAILVPLFFLPFFGVYQTLFFLIGLNILASLALYSIKA